MPEYHLLKNDTKNHPVNEQVECLCDQFVPVAIKRPLLIGHNSWAMQCKDKEKDTCDLFWA